MTTPTLDAFCRQFDVERTPTGRLTTAGAERLVSVMTRRMAELAAELALKEIIIQEQAAQIAKLQSFTGALFT